MKKVLLFLLVVGSIWAAMPWSLVGLPQLDKQIGTYKLGLDLHGGVELDYLVDFPADMEATRRTQVIEDMKTILDGRVRRIGTTEPTLNTAQYGEETHIVVQIPTPSEFNGLPALERAKKDADFIREAKAVIGQVIKVQFREMRPENEYNDLLAKRGEVVTAIDTDFQKKTIPFDSFAQKVSDSYENVFYFKNQDIKNYLKGQSNIPAEQEVTLETLKKIIGDMAITGKKFEGKIAAATFADISGNGFIFVEALDGGDILPGKPLDVNILLVGKEPLRFRPALGSNKEPLNERYLINTVATPDPTTGQYVVNLVFNTEGQKMFGDITERNAGKVIAIFLGNKLLTAPNVSQRIDGNAIITSGAEADTKKWATELSKNINEGIVPVAIYEHSEKAIGPNLGQASLRQLVLSGFIGLILVTLLIFWRYRMDGVVAIFGLTIHVVFLLAMVRLLGITMTLSGIAGIVLGIGIAIDSNILLLERVKDYLRQGRDMRDSLRLGFEGAWATVWDSNITGLLVGIILWWMGVSLVKGFGQMTVLGILISLFVIKYLCNPLTVWWRTKMEK